MILDTDFSELFLVGEKSMVQLMKSGNLPAEPETTSSSGNKVPVKLEIVEDPLEEEHGSLNKRSKPSQAVQQVLIMLQYVCSFGEKINENNGEYLINLLLLLLVQFNLAVWYPVFCCHSRENWKIFRQPNS